MQLHLLLNKYQRRMCQLLRIILSLRNMTPLCKHCRNLLRLLLHDMWVFRLVLALKL
jgi:hypothetical protein